MKNQPEAPTGVGAVYNRVSAPSKQDPARQRAKLQGWLDRHKIVVPDQFWIEDDGSRDLMEERPGFQKLMKLVRAEAIQWVLLPEFDRFGIQNWKHLGKYLVEMEAHGVDLWSVDRGLLSGNDFATDVELFISAHMSKEEQHKIGSRVLSKKREGFKTSYQGGHIPFGYDVVCIDQQGQEKWRVLHRGREKVEVYDKERERHRHVYLQRRFKVYPDGRQEEYTDTVLDRKPYIFKNPPSKDRTDRLVLGLTKDERIVRAIKAVFQTYAEQSVSFRRLGEVLETIARPYYLPAWTGQQIAELLADTTYVGVHYDGKFSYGKHARFHKGEYAPPRPVKGKVRRGVRNPKEDWVKAEYDIDPIFDLADPRDRTLWEGVQAKLEGREKQATPNAPRNERLWLAGLLYCAHCGQRMRGWHVDREDKRYAGGRRNYTSYFCNTWDQDHSKCDRNTIEAGLIESVVKKYVEDNHRHLKLLGDPDAAVTREMLAPLRNAVWQAQADVYRLGQDIVRYMRPFLADPEKVEEAVSFCLSEGYRSPTEAPICAMYRFFFGQESPRLGDDVAAKEAELKAMIAGLHRLSGVALDRASEMANYLGEQIRGLKARQESLADQFDRLCDEVRGKTEALGRLQEGLKEESSYRRAAQDLAAVVQRVECRFEPTGKEKPKTKLVEVTFHARGGGVSSYQPDETSVRRSRGSRARALRAPGCPGTRTPPG